MTRPGWRMENVQNSIMRCLFIADNDSPRCTLRGERLKKLSYNDGRHHKLMVNLPHSQSEQSRCLKRPPWAHVHDNWTAQTRPWGLGFELQSRSNSNYNPDLLKLMTASTKQCSNEVLLAGRSHLTVQISCQRADCPTFPGSRATLQYSALLHCRMALQLECGE
jgi:hypothetical protein